MLVSAGEACEASMEEAAEVGETFITSCLYSCFISSWSMALLSWTHLLDGCLVCDYVCAGSHTRTLCSRDMIQLVSFHYRYLFLEFRVNVCSAGPQLIQRPILVS